jgi:hypothetical protein
MPTESPVLTNPTGQQSSETKERYRAFFQELIDELRDRYQFTNARAGQPQNWYTFSSENSRIFKYSTSFTRGGRVMAELYIDTGDKAKNEQIFNCLSERKEEIERGFGSALSWEQLETKRACRVAIYMDGDIDGESEALAQVREWAIQNLLRFKAVFPEYVRGCVQGIAQRIIPADAETAPRP